MPNNAIYNTSQVPLIDPANGITVTGANGDALTITYSNDASFTFSSGTTGGSDNPLLYFTTVGTSCAGHPLIIETDSTAGIQIAGEQLVFNDITSNTYLSFGSGSDFTINAHANGIVMSGAGFSVITSGNGCTVEDNNGGDVSIIADGGGDIHFNVNSGGFFINNIGFGWVYNGSGSPSSPPTVSAGQVSFYYDTTAKKIWAWNPTLATPAWETPSVL